MRHCVCRPFRLRVAAVVAIAWLTSLAYPAPLHAQGKRNRETTAPQWTRVRPLQPRAADAIRMGYRRSARFRELLDEIEQSDLVVYVDVNPYRAHSSAAFLQFMSKTAGLRYVLAWVDPKQDGTGLVASLGHELEHAVELARARDVSTRAGFDAFYRSVGHVSGREQYETAAAHEAGNQIRGELFATAASLNANDSGR